MGMPISVDSPSDETLKRGSLVLLLRRQYEFPFGINIVQFSIFFFFIHFSDLSHVMDKYLQFYIYFKTRKQISLSSDKRRRNYFSVVVLRYV